MFRHTRTKFDKLLRIQLDRTNIRFIRRKTLQYIACTFFPRVAFLARPACKKTTGSSYPREPPKRFKEIPKKAPAAICEGNLSCGTGISLEVQLKNSKDC